MGDGDTDRGDRVRDVPFRPDRGILWVDKFRVGQVFGRVLAIVERFNGRISSEVLGINIYSHRALEQLLRGFDAAYNARRQRVLDSKTSDQIVAERLKATLALAKGQPHGRAGPCDTTKACLIAEAAKEVSQPDKQGAPRRSWG